MRHVCSLAKKRGADATIKHEWAAPRILAWRHGGSEMEPCLHAELPVVDWAYADDDDTLIWRSLSRNALLYGQEWQNHNPRTSIQRMKNSTWLMSCSFGGLKCVKIRRGAVLHDQTTVRTRLELTLLNFVLYVDGRR